MSEEEEGKGSLLEEKRIRWTSPRLSVEKGKDVLLSWSANEIRAARATLSGGIHRRARRGKRQQVLSSQMDASGGEKKEMLWRVEEGLPCDIYTLVLSSEDDKDVFDTATVCVAEPLQYKRINAREVNFSWSKGLFDEDWRVELVVYRKHKEFRYDQVERHVCTVKEALAGEFCMSLEPTGSFCVRAVAKNIKEEDWMQWRSKPVKFKMGFVVLEACGSGYYCQKQSRSLWLADGSSYVRKGPCAGLHNCGNFEVRDRNSEEKTNFAQEGGLNVVVLDCYTLKVLYDRTFDTFSTRNQMPLGAELFMSAVSPRGELGPNSFFFKDPRKQFLFVITSQRAFELNNQKFGAMFADFLMGLGLQKKYWAEVYRYATLLDTSSSGGYPFAFVGIPGQTGWHVLNVQQKNLAEVKVALTYDGTRWNPVMVKAHSNHWESWLPVSKLLQVHSAFLEATLVEKVSEAGRLNNRRARPKIIGGQAISEVEQYSPRSTNTDSERSEGIPDGDEGTIPAMLDEQEEFVLPSRETIAEYILLLHGLGDFVLSRQFEEDIDILGLTSVLLDWSHTFQRLDSMELWMDAFTNVLEDTISAMLFPSSSPDIAAQIVCAGAVEYFVHSLQKHLGEKSETAIRRTETALTVLSGLVALEDGFLVAEIVRRDGTDAILQAFLHCLERWQLHLSEDTPFFNEVRELCCLDDPEELGTWGRIYDILTVATAMLADHNYKRASMSIRIQPNETLPELEESESCLFLHAVMTGLIPTSTAEIVMGMLHWCELKYDDKKQELRSASGTKPFDDGDVFSKVIFLKGSDAQVFVHMALQAPRLVRLAEARGASAVVFVWPRRFVQHLLPNPNYETTVTIPSFSVPRSKALVKLCSSQHPIFVRVHCRCGTSDAVLSRCGMQLSHACDSVEFRSRSNKRAYVNFKEASTRILSRIGATDRRMCRYPHHLLPFRKDRACMKHEVPIRILSLDGGGIRGLVSVQILKKISRACGHPLSELFDLVAGNSAGGLIAMSIATGVANEKLEVLYRDACSEIFQKDSWNDFLLQGPGHASTRRFERVVRKTFGEHADSPLLDLSAHVGCPKVCVTACLVSRNPACVVAMRNYKDPSWQGSHPSCSDGRIVEEKMEVSKEECVDEGPLLSIGRRIPGEHEVTLLQALRATSAAPWYMEELVVLKDVYSGKMDGNQKESRVMQSTSRLRYIDGAFAVNNPASLALQEVRRIYGHDRPVVLVSVGTGLGLPEPVSPSYPSWLQNAMAASFDVDLVDATVRDLLGPRDRYFRFNPVGEHFGCALDDMREEILESIVRDTGAYMASRGNDLASLPDLLRPAEPRGRCWCIGTRKESACCRSKDEQEKN